MDEGKEDGLGLYTISDGQPLSMSAAAIAQPFSFYVLI